MFIQIKNTPPNIFPTYIITSFFSVADAYPRKNSMELKKKLQEVTYVMDRIAVSISLGNTNHVGRDAWYRFFDQLQECVSDYVNNLKEVYRTSQ